MTLTKRIVPCLDVREGRVVKGINFINLRDAGDPVELGKRYSEDGADELVYLDITASSEKRDILTDLVRSVASELTIPFTVGGGIRNVEDAKKILCNGADKVAINTAAVENPSLIKELSEVFGMQCIVVTIDAKRRYDALNGRIKVDTDNHPTWFEVHTYGGRKPTNLDALEWSEKVAQLGAGELLVTSMDKDGTKTGFDLDLLKAIGDRVSIPIIASGGAGQPEDFREAFEYGNADAALAASVFHYEEYPIKVVKAYLHQKGVDVRL